MYIHIAMLMYTFALTPCTVENLGDRRTLLRSTLARRTGAVIRDRAASASAPSWIADEFTSSRKDDSTDLLCSGEKLSKASDDLGSGNFFAGPLSAWGNFLSEMHATTEQISRARVAVARHVEQGG